MELAGKKIAFDEDLSDAQIKDLHEHYNQLWDTLKKTFEFKDEFNITINNRSVFNDNPDELVIQLAKYDDWDALTADAVKHAKAWVDEMNKEANKEKKEPKRELTD